MAMLKIRSVTDISDTAWHYSFGYYAERKWISESRIVLIRGNTPDIAYNAATRAKTELIIFDIETGSITVIDENIPSFTDFLVAESKIYYVKDGALICFNADTCEKKTLFREKSIGSPHITKDGRVISLFSCSPEICRFFRVDTESGGGELLFETTFGEPHPYANHGMISPTDPDILFFAHEGNTKEISDRLWIYSAREKTARNIAKQAVDEKGSPIDCFGHEAWSHDGAGLYFVKYRESRARGGICYADIEGNKPELLYTGADYWHVGASESGRYLTADTRNLGADRSGVVLIDKATGEEKLMDTPCVTFRHPCHPHPQLSPSDSKLVYHFENEHGNTAVRIAFLE